MTNLPISKLTELATFYGMTRSEYLKALINKEHKVLLDQISNSNYLKDLLII